MKTISKQLLALSMLMFLTHTVLASVVLVEDTETIKEGLDELLAFLEMILLTILYILLASVIVGVFMHRNKRLPKYSRVFEVGVKLGCLVLLIFSLLFIFVVLPAEDIETNISLFIIAIIVGFFPISTLIVVASIGDVFMKRLFNLVIVGICTGFIIALVSFIINTNAYAILSTFGGNELLFFIIIAPIVEEVLKFLGVWKVMKIKNTTSALLVAIIIGGAFASFENLIYFSININPFEQGLKNWVNILINRTFVTANAHGYFAALSGYGLTKKSGHNMLLYLLCAIALHSVFNTFGLLFYAVHAKELLTFVMALVFFVVLLKIARSTKTYSKARQKTCHR